MEEIKTPENKKTETTERVKAETAVPAKAEVKAPAKAEVKAPAKAEAKAPAEAKKTAPAKVSAEAQAPEEAKKTAETKAPAKVSAEAQAPEESDAPAVVKAPVKKLDPVKPESAAEADKTAAAKNITRKLAPVSTDTRKMDSLKSSSGKEAADTVVSKAATRKLDSLRDGSPKEHADDLDDTGDLFQTIDLNKAADLKKTTDFKKASDTAKAAARKTGTRKTEDQKDPVRKSADKKSSDKKSFDKKSSDKKSSGRKEADGKEAGKKKALKKGASGKDSSKKGASGKKPSAPIHPFAGVTAVSVLIFFGELFLLLYRIPMTAIIGDEGNNYFSCAFDLYAFVLILTAFGLPPVISRMTAVRFNQGRKAAVCKFLKGAFLTAMILAAAGALILFFGSSLLAGALLRSPMGVFALEVMIPALFFAGLLAVIRGFFEGIGDTGRLGPAKALGRIVNAAAAITCSWMLFRYGALTNRILNNTDRYSAAYGAAGSAIGLTLGTACTLIFMGVALVLFLKQMHENPSASRFMEEESLPEIMKGILTGILPEMAVPAVCGLALILSQALFKNVTCLQGFSEDQVGIWWGLYSGKYLYLTAVIVLIACTAASRVKDSMKLRVITLITFPCSAFLMVLGRPLMLVLFPGTSDTASVAGNIFHIGGIAILLYAQAIYAILVLLKKKRFRTVLQNTAASALVYLVSLVLILLIFRIHIYAAAIANVVFALLLWFTNSLAASRASGFPSGYRETFLYPAACSVIMIVASLIAYELLFMLSGSVIAAFILAFLLALILYTVTFLLMKGLTEKDLAELPHGELLIFLFNKVNLL